MLKKLRIHNFRTYLNAEFEFTARHLVIGANNSGKTSLCAAMRLLSRSAVGELDKAAQVVPGGALEISNWALDSDIVELSCRCQVPFEGQPHVFTYVLEIAVGARVDGPQRGQSALSVKKEELTVSGPGLQELLLLENDGHSAKMRHEGSDEGYMPKTLAPANATMLSKLYELETNRRAIAFRKYLASWLYFSLSPQEMRFGWRDARADGLGLDTNGKNLAVFLYQLKNFNESCYRRVLDHVRVIEPELEAINFLVTPDQAPVPFVELRSRSQASWVGLSDGTLRCLALALIAEAVGVGSSGSKDWPLPLVIIEEPENGLFPGQLRRLFDMFDDRTGSGQFIFTSHSPYFINFFDASRDSVTLLRRKKEMTEVVPIPPADSADADRFLLAEQYSMELFD